MTSIPWTPWHKVVQLRDDLKSGELSLAAFAADLDDVALRRGKRRVYENPAEFFALTYPTYNLRELARDVVRRLAGDNDKAVRQLELTYGGGKTHALITLFHLANDPAALPDLPAVQEFVNHIGIRPQQARVAVISFDKLDVEKGMEVRGPDGVTRWLKQPWSVLAYQLAGVDGLRLLHADGLDAERESAPAENLLVELLSIPVGQGLAVLILMDEILMYAREKIGLDPAWRSRLVNFFQYLTQAVTKVDRAALVASLLATDPRKSDTLGKELTGELYGVFRREREEGVQPVVKEDVAEVLRRRFFTPASIRDRSAFRPHVVAALHGIAELDEQTQHAGKAAEERFLHSYPFHPDLTDIFYTKWTNLEGFQRTRGVLRTFALALRDAVDWDDCPLVGANVFLGRPGQDALGEAARELTTVAATEEYEGKKQEWSPILEGELAKARAVAEEYPALHHREVEQAVFATFLHSQPIGQKALTRELFLLLGATRPDRIELEKAVRRWAEVSWFLDEEGLQAADSDADGRKGLPRSWRLGTRPNLKQMHDDACQYRVSTDLVNVKLREEIEKLKNLTAGAREAGARVHNLPDKPSDVDDDGEFHYVVLGPMGASAANGPGKEARRFLTETTGPDRPRVRRNAVVLAVPSVDGLDATREAVLDYLAWVEVQTELSKQDLSSSDPVRWGTLLTYVDTARKAIPGVLRQAYSIVVTVGDKGDVEAFKIVVDEKKPLFALIKADSRSRIQDTAVTAEALLPGGPYDLWREGEPARRVDHLVNAFAERPHLPKMLKRQAILDTLVNGCVEGFLVLRLARPDKSLRTFWRQHPDEVALKEPGLEAVLPEEASLAELSPALLAPGVLPELWQGAALTVGDLYAYFAGGHVVKVQREGYEEPVSIPEAQQAVIDAAVGAAVKSGKLWLTAGPASIWAEEIPPGLLTAGAVLQAPPMQVTSVDVLREQLPEAWSGEITTALGVAAALSQRAGKTLPWAIVQRALDGAFHAHLLERTLDSGPWPCDYAGAGSVRLRVPGDVPPPPPPPPPPLKPGVFVAEAELTPTEMQDLGEALPDLMAAAAGCGLKFRVRVEVGSAKPPDEEMVAKMNQVLGHLPGGPTLA